MFAFTCFLYSVLAVFFLSDTDYLCVCLLTGGAGTKWEAGSPKKATHHSSAVWRVHPVLLWWVGVLCVRVCVPAYVCLCGGGVLACMYICKCTYEFSRWQILKDRNMCQAWWLSPDFLGKAYQDFVQICKINDVCQNCASLGNLDLVSDQKCS